MFWALLFALIFTGGSQSALLNLDFKKDIRKFVENKENKKQILTITKSYEKEAKDFMKKEKKMAKQMEQLNSKRTTTEDEFREFFTNAMTHYKQLQQNELRSQFYNACIETHGKLVKVTTVEEWDKVIKSVNRIF